MKRFPDITSNVARLTPAYSFGCVSKPFRYLHYTKCFVTGGTNTQIKQKHVYRHYVIEKSTKLDFSESQRSLLVPESHDQVML